MTYTTIKDYIKAYQDGNTDALNHLITFKHSTYRGESHVRLQFTDKKLNNLLQSLSLQNQHVPATDIEAWFIEALYKDDKRGVFNTCKIKKSDDPNDKEEYSPTQVAKFVEKTIIGYIKNKIERSTTYGKKSDGLHGLDVISDVFKLEDGSEASYVDDYSFDTWNEPESFTSGYETFIDSIGGLSNLLTAKQAEYYELHLFGLNQQEIADECGVKQSTISGSLATTQNKIRSGYLDWKMMQLIVKENGNPFKIGSDYLDRIEKIMEFDVADSFDYYGYTRSYLLNVIAESDLTDDYHQLHLNKHDNRDSFFDVLMSHCKPSHYQLLLQVLRDDSEIVLKRDKTRFTNAISFCVHGILADVKRVVKEYSANAIDKIVA